MEYFTSLLFVLLVFASILLFSRKIQLGYSLFLGTVLLGLLFRMPFYVFIESIYYAAIARRTIELVISIFIVLGISEAMKESGQMEKIVKTTINLLHDIRLATFFMPALIGLLPMPGGAYFSAPMVESALKGTSLPPLKKNIANYWFRHIWEYINPLYPGIIAVAALTGLGFSAILKTNIWLTLTAIATGAVMVFIPADKTISRSKPYKGSMREASALLQGIFPIIVVLALTILFNVHIVIALATGLLLFLLLQRFSLKSCLTVIKRAASVKMLLILLGISFFQAILENSGAVEEIAAFLKSSNIGIMPVIFGIPFLSGFVTGITIAFVGMSLPIVLPLLPEITTGNMMFVFAAGYGGVLLSPVHLCFVITCQYFRINMLSMYKYLIPATLLIIAVGLIGYITG